MNQVSDILNVVFTLLFTVEMVLKLIAFKVKVSEEKMHKTPNAAHQTLQWRHSRVTAGDV